MSKKFCVVCNTKLGKLRCKTIITNIKVRITLKNISNSIIFITLHEDYDLQTGTDRYNNIIEEVQTLIGSLKNLQNY